MIEPMGPEAAGAGGERKATLFLSLAPAMAGFIVRVAGLGDETALGDDCRLPLP